MVRRQRSPSARILRSRDSARLRPFETRHRRCEPESRPRTSHRPAATSATTGGRRVLIVDDEFSIRVICSINLAASGWQCMEAADGEDALERIKHERPDVILLDVMMPRADGWTVAERLAEDPATRDIPVVFLTARAEPHDRDRARCVGAVGYLTKPLDPVRLPDVIAEILRRLEQGEREQLRAEVLTDR